MIGEKKYKNIELYYSIGQKVDRLNMRGLCSPISEIIMLHCGMELS
jgi:hypothetical protein